MVLVTVSLTVLCQNVSIFSLMSLYHERLCNCKDLEQAMPNLKQLEIWSCQRLKVPAGLKHLKSLCELELKDMHVEFTATIKETKEQKWSAIAHSLAIID